MKVLALDEHAVHLRKYANKFREQPNDVDPAILRLGGLDGPADSGIGHFPLVKERFFLKKPVLIKVVPITEDELEGYRLYVEKLKSVARAWAHANSRDSGLNSASECTAGSNEVAEAPSPGALATVASSQAARASAKPEAPRFPLGTIDVQVLAIGIPDGPAQIAERVQKAIQERPEWFQEYSRQYIAKGEPLPYHRNFGVSEAEYEQYLKVPEQIQLVPDFKATIQVDADPENGDRILLNGGAQLADLHDVTIDYLHMAVQTPLGECLDGTFGTGPAWRNLGPYEAWRWSAETGDALGERATFKTMSMALVRLLERKVGLMYYQGGEMRDGAVLQNVRVVFTFPLDAQHP